MQYSIKGNQLAGGADHRQAARVPLNDSLVFRAKNQSNHGGLLRDVSESGLYFFSETELQVKAQLVFYLPLKIGRKKRLCMVAGTIVRQENGEAKSFGYGVRFEKKEALDANVILHDFVVFKTTGFLPERTYPNASPSGISSPGVKLTPPIRGGVATKSAPSRKSMGIAKTDKLDVHELLAQRKLPVKKKSRLPTTLLVVGLIGVGIGAFIAIRKISFHSSMTQSVPILSSSIVGDTLRAEVETKWFYETPVQVKRQKLAELYFLLRAKEIDGIILTTPDGTKVASVLRNINASNAPRIDLSPLPSR